MQIEAFSGIPPVSFTSATTAQNMHLVDTRSGPDGKPDATLGSWYVYRRANGRRRGSYVGPFEGPDAALAHLRDAIELELLLLDEAGRSSSLFRVSRRAAA
ncbi:MAG: hypothetical protein JO352_22330 [Chloroflexi bacterium]|nr:hypothetical protein [Chloroflexota bacterium]MBV9596381.1 hypothetical protein [Chloroflexota bacterium]